MTKVTKYFYAPRYLWIWIRMAFVARKYRKNRTKFSQQWRNDFIVKYAEKILKMFKVKINVHGYHRIPSKGPALFMSNHASFADSLILVVALKKQTFDKNVNNKIATFIAKYELSQSRLYKNCLDIIDTVYLNRNNARQALDAFASLGKFVKKFKTYPVIYPSGTRIEDGTAGEFKKAAFTFPKKELIPIVPVTIKNSILAFKITNKRKEKQLNVDIYFHLPIKAPSIVALDKEGIMKKVHKIVSSKL